MRVCGEAAVADMLKVFSEVETATLTLEWNGLGLTFPSPQMIMQHWAPGALSPELNSVIPRYQAALDAARRASSKAQPSGKDYVNYWVGRLEFALRYLNAIQAVHAAANAESNKDYAGAL